MLWLPAAEAAEILVLVESNLSVEVDGSPLRRDLGERQVTAAGLAGGTHRVRLFEGERLLSTTNVSVATDEQLRLEVRKGVLTELGRGQLPTSIPGREVPVARAPQPSELTITGLDPKLFTLVLDGHAVGADRNGAFHLRWLVTDPGVLTVAPLVSGPVPWSGPDLDRLIAAMKAASFSSDQLALVSGAARDRAVTVAQVGAVMDTLTHGSDKVEAARILAPNVTDRQNAWQLESHLTFSTDKEALRAVFAK